MSLTYLERRDATQATLAHWRDRPLAWGGDDCGGLAMHQARKFGHSAKLGGPRTYRTEAGAVKLLRKRGFSDLADWVDHALGPDARIPIASAWIGDLVGIRHAEAPKAMTSLGVLLHPGQVLAFHTETKLCTPMEFDPAFPGLQMTAWRL